MASSAARTPKAKPLAYRYEAFASTGRTVTGVVKSLTEGAAMAALEKKGYQVINLQIAPSALSLEQAIPSLFKVKPREIILFTRQIATLLDAGITLLPALELTQAQAGTGRAFRKLVGSVIDDIRTGSSFSHAIGKHSHVFGEIYCRTISTGERTGELQATLKQMVKHLEKHGDISKKISKALTYPVMVACVTVVVVGVLITTALPPLIELFVDVKAELPLPTKILMKATEVIGVYKFQMAASIFFIVTLGFWYVKQPAGRRLADELALRVPIVGTANHMAEVARFSRTLSVLIVAGLPLQEVMQMMPQTTNNSVMRSAINRLYQGLLLGEGIASPMSRIKVFPPLLVQMVNVGEESNTLETTVGVVADFFESAAEERVAGMVGVLQPLTTIIMSLVVAFIALSIIMPMYSIMGSFG
ncbi:MAG: type II secretion system F family protein [Chloroflexi bacterium]|nr:type II secretion system F family protein [Chloroflexota bacterium]